MIPEIGLMVGGYIIVRMLELLARDPKAPSLAIAALGSIAVTLFVMADLFYRGATFTIPELGK